ncbi:hypothetical protein PMIN06_004310 [Paraphaeosphaeria minitans]
MRDDSARHHIAPALDSRPHALTPSPLHPSLRRARPYCASELLQTSQSHNSTTAIFRPSPAVHVAPAHRDTRTRSTPLPSSHSLILGRGSAFVVSVRLTDRYHTIGGLLDSHALPLALHHA